MRKLLFILLLCVAANNASTQELSRNLWDGNPTVESSDPTDTAKVYIFLPTNVKAPTRAVLICPGGGYANLAMPHEGYDWAPFFNNMGIAAVELKYRMPHGNREVPISDGEQAMRLIRDNAKEWNINPEDVGVMGFSAGGHLASTLTTHAPEALKPNFEILFYPVISMDLSITHRGSHDNLLGEEPAEEDVKLYSNDLQVSPTTPRTLLLLSDDDDIVDPINSLNYYYALYKNHIPASMFIYPSGGHGWGMNLSFRYHTEMLMNMRAWLESF